MTSFLRQRRILLGVSQADLAERIGVSQQTVARWETSGQIPAKYLKDLAITLGARPEDFLPKTSDARVVPLNSKKADPTQSEDDASLPFGDVCVRFGCGADAVRYYPVTWGTLNRIQEQLGDVGVGFGPTAPWVCFETLNNKWVALNALGVDRLTFVDDNVEAMTDYEHPEVYKAARALWDRMPSPKELEQEDFPYTKALVVQVATLLKAAKREPWAEFDGFSVEFASGECVSHVLNDEVAMALDGMAAWLGHEDAAAFMALPLRDNGTFEHVRLAAVRCIECSLLALNEALEQEEATSS